MVGDHEVAGSNPVVLTNAASWVYDGYVNLQKYAIQDERGRYLWGVTFRSGVHFDSETMPQFWEMNEKTLLFSTERDAKLFAEKHDIKAWTRFKIVPGTIEIHVPPGTATQRA